MRRYSSKSTQKRHARTRDSHAHAFTILTHSYTHSLTTVTLRPNHKLEFAVLCSVLCALCPVFCALVGPVLYFKCHSSSPSFVTEPQLPFPPLLLITLISSHLISSHSRLGFECHRLRSLCFLVFLITVNSILAWCWLTVVSTSLSLYLFCWWLPSPLALLSRPSPKSAIIDGARIDAPLTAF